MLTVHANQKAEPAARFCAEFLASPLPNRLIFGTNEYAEAIASQVEVGGFIDDFRAERTFLGKPVLKTSEAPTDALVIAALLGRPLTARRILDNAGLRHLDLFSFHLYSGVTFPPVRFWNRFADDFNAHQQAYEAVWERMADEPSRQLYEGLVNFRLSGDLRYIDTFAENQKNQYFEDFLQLGSRPGEVFVDVGGYDGYTSAMFARLCPDYRAIYLFEPTPENLLTARKKLGGLANVHVIEKGASDQPGTVRFSADGSIGAVSEDGEVEIEVERIDAVLQDPATLIKIDIEGGEHDALEGARETILRDHPRLAICVYHKPEDLRQIPQQILAMRDDYDLHLRHYTEGLVETVMFFMPK